jgi:hypothetical protein
MAVALFMVFNRIWQPTTRYRFSLLVITFLVYLLFGGLIFSLLNLPQEKIEISNLLSYQNEFYQNKTCVNQKDLEDLVVFTLKLNTYGIYYYDLYNNLTYQPEWTFGGNTIFFVYTTLATVGYGNLVPYTNMGKLFCIFYIIIGVPITLLLLGILTEYFTGLIEDTFFLNNKDNSNNTTETSSSDNNDLSVNTNNLKLLLKYSIVFIIFLIFIYIIPAIFLSVYTESNWSFLEAIYFCFISLTTIGLGIVLTRFFFIF